MIYKVRLAIRGLIGIVFFMIPTIFIGMLLFYAALISRDGKLAFGGEWIITAVIALYNVSFICKMLNKRERKEVRHDIRDRRRSAAARQSREYANHSKRAC